LVHPYSDNRKSTTYSGATYQKTKRADLCANTKPTLEPQPSNERMKIMATHSSASLREEKPHLSAAIKERAQSLKNNKSIDGISRAIISYGLETDDPWLPELVRRVDAGDAIDDNTLATLAGRERSSEERIETLTALICRTIDEPATKSAALLVLMATIANSTHPKDLANTAKHLAFNCRGELNLYDTVDAQVAALESELFADDKLVS
jgi:hypothetical protein